MLLLERLMSKDAQLLSIDRNFFIKIEKVKEMVSVIFKSFMRLAARLGLFDKRLSNYQQQQGYSWVDAPTQIQIKSDFYGYIKQNQKNMTLELKELNSEYLTCKKEFKNLIDEVEHQKVNLVRTNYKNTFEKDGLIKFPKLEKLPNYEVLENISDLFDSSEKIVKQVEQKHEHILHKTQDVILEMRKQF